MNQTECTGKIVRNVQINLGENKMRMAFSKATAPGKTVLVVLNIHFFFCRASNKQFEHLLKLKKGYKISQVT